MEVNNVEDQTKYNPDMFDDLAYEQLCFLEFKLLLHAEDSIEFDQKFNNYFAMGKRNCHLNYHERLVGADDLILVCKKDCETITSGRRVLLKFFILYFPFCVFRINCYMCNKKDYSFRKSNQKKGKQELKTPNVVYEDINTPT